jgi:chromosome segregation protein
MEGFRGVRARQRINIPDGFLVVTGRNGSGKSTICDAIEFALTGVLSKYEESKERGESTEQYLWWRGTRPAVHNFVRVGVRDDMGREFVVTRTPTGGDVSDGRDLASALCDVSVVTREPLAQLCRTAIIRDETVAAMSIDMAEEQRFTFVRTALGTDALDDVARRGKDVLALLKKDVQAAAAAYDRAREGVTHLVAEVARARALVAEQVDVSTAEDAVRQLLGQDIREPARLLAAARQHMATARRQQDALLRVSSELQVLQAEAEAVAGPAATAEREALAMRQRALAAELETASADFARLQERAAVDREVAPLRARIASLYEVGRAIGRRDHACPLCATPMDEERFAAALEALAREVARADRDAAAVRAQLAEAGQRVEALRSDLTGVEVQLRRATAARDELTGRFGLLAEQARTYGARFEGQPSAEGIRAHVQAAQQELDSLGSGVAVLEASAGLERVAELERQLQQAREASEALEARLRQLEAAEARAKRLLNGVRRAVGEVVEERLAALDPLLKDLYARLRPHADWTELNYKVRGEVRKFLSLRVGEEVNPRFTFSSGQRRAIGLAFLLAVHLSRPWCRFRSLILDDPIQHIDDFRSLHLVEVLGAIRKAGQQILCAVEDEELAELMCRRIRSGKEGEGRLVRMAYRTGDGATMESSSIVPAPARNLVVPW